ncbi:transglutaminase family protein [Williamsia sp.]|uniref:transglutaminase-like domain-containing protein n=1 Tax=Williamsia sp. TaxID=1872085 RepID=UPI002F94598E
MHKRDISAHLDVEITDETDLEFQIAVAPHPGAQVTETLSFVLDGQPVNAKEISAAEGNRIHLLHAGVGKLTVEYQATVVGNTAPAMVTEYDRSLYLRPSRYAEADKFFGWAAKQFDTSANPAELLESVAAWVGSHLDYTPGASGPTDGASDTLLAGAGVCRDYAHLVVAVLRALNVPARLVAVYAPGCDPMDFHAVAEAVVDDQWRVVDATCLAPRQTLVRISTGRDAADTAFLDNHGGAIILNSATVTAVVDGQLPSDDLADLVSIT